MTDSSKAVDDQTITEPGKDGVVWKRPSDFNPGLTVERILLTVTVVHGRDIGQFDDSCSHLLEKHLKEYEGIKLVDARVMYDHTRIDIHVLNCDCYWCKLAREAK